MHFSNLVLGALSCHHSLLYTTGRLRPKQKHVPTLHRFRQILKKIVDTKQSMGKTMRESAFALTEAKYAAGEFRHTVFDSVETVGLLDAASDGLAWMACQTQSLAC